MKYILISIFVFSMSAFGAAKPKAKISLSPDSGYVPLAQVFDGSGSTASEGTIVSYSWDFGDGSPIVTGAIVSHTYQENKIYHARLTVTDSNGKDDFDLKTIKFLKDREAPTLTFDLPNGYQSLISTPLITAFYSDATSKINLQKVEFKLDGEDVTNKASLNQGHATLQFTTEWPLSPGPHSLVVKISDYYNNITTKTLSFSYTATTSSTSFLSGKVVDVNGSPLKGAVLTSMAGPVKTLLQAVSDQEGNFSIPFTIGGEYKIEVSLPEYLTLFKFVSLNTGESTALETIVLAEADPKITVIGTAGGEATNSTDTIAIIVPPNSLPGDKPISFSEASTGQTLQVPLPNGSAFTFAHNAQPSGTVFSSPADMWIKNLLGFAPGTEIPVGVTDEELGIWSDSGFKGVVSEDGSKIDFKVAHFSDHDLNYPTASPPGPPQIPPILIADNAPGQPCLNGCGTVEGSRIHSGTGNISVDYELPPIFRRGENIARKLTYTSSSVKKVVTVGASTRDLVNNDDPDQIDVTWAFLDKRFYKTYQGKGVAYSFYNNFTIDLPNNTTIPTGTYRTSVSIASVFNDRMYAEAEYFGGPAGQSLGVGTREAIRLEENINSKAVVFNQIESPFGAGWNMTGFEKVFENPDNGIVTWTSGKEFTSYFVPINSGSGNYVTQKLATGSSSNLHYHKGYVYGADCSTNQVFKIDSLGRYTMLAGGSQSRHVSLNCPSSVFPARRGGIYIADTGNSRVLHLKDNGDVKVLASASRGGLNNPTFVTEDNVLAVHVIDGDEIKTISPHDGKVLSMIGNNSDSSFKFDLKKPTQIHYDKNYNLLVLDSERGQLIKFYIDAGISRVLLSNLAGLKEMTFDKVRDLHYFLFQNGRLSLWEGNGKTLIHNLDTSTESFKVIDEKSKVKDFKKFTSITYSPSAGLVLGSDAGVKIRALDMKKKAKATNLFYLLLSDDRLSNAFFKNPDGYYFRVLPDNKFVGFFPDGKMQLLSDLSTQLNESYVYNSSGQLTELVFSNNRGSYIFNYDSNGKIASIVDPANQATTLTLDGNNDLITITDEEGNTNRYEYGSPHVLLKRYNEIEQLTTYVYSSSRAKKVFKPGALTLTFMDEITNQIESVTQPDAPPLPAADKKFLVTSPEGRVSGFLRGTAGSVDADIDGYGHYTYYERNEKLLPTAIRTPEGRENLMSYDFRGNLTTSSDENGNWTFFWDLNTNKIVQATDGFNNNTQFNYNNGMLVSVTTPTNYVQNYIYDNSNNLIEIQDSLGSITKLERDARGDLVSLIDPVGNKTAMAYTEAGNLSSVTDPFYRTTSFEYDLHGRMTKSTDPEDGVTMISYSPIGDIETVTDARSKMTAFDYNDQRKVTKITNSEGQETHYSYDLDGNILSKLTKANQTINYSYDNNNRLKTKTFTGDSVTYNYDKDGMLIKASDSDSIANFSYDILGRLTSEKGNHYSGIVSNKYDVRGSRVSTSVVANGKQLITINRSFGTLGEMFKAEAWINGKQTVVDIFNDQSNLSSGEQFANGIRREIVRDAAKRPLQIKMLGSNLNTTLEYSYNATGSITMVNEVTSGRPRVAKYGYDFLQRLSSEDSQVKTWSYNLDAVGNDISVNFVQNNLNQILESTDYLYEYDLNGNRTKKTHRFTGERVEYTWTAENQLVSASIYKNSLLTKTIGYQYDALGRRIQRSVNDPVNPLKSYVRKYIYDGQQVIGILDGDNNFVSAYIHGEGIDDPLVMVTDYDKDGDMDVLSLLKDHLGSVRMIVNEDQQVLEEIHYSAYGETQIKLVGQNTAKVGNNFYYTGRELEIETGDYYYRARYYDPYSQKFLSEDPQAIASGDPNFYRYCLNSPTNCSDPSGEWAHFFIGAAIGAIPGLIAGDMTAATVGAAAGALGSAKIVGAGFSFFIGAGASLTETALKGGDVLSRKSIRNAIMSGGASALGAYTGGLLRGKKTIQITNIKYGHGKIAFRNEVSLGLKAGVGGVTGGVLDLILKDKSCSP